MCRSHYCESALKGFGKWLSRKVNKPLYAAYGLSFLWLVNPKTGVLEAYRLVGDDWESQGVYRGDETVCVEPFELVSITVDELLA